MAAASPLLFWSFVLLGMLLGAAFVAAVRVAWLRTGAGAGAAGRATALAATGTVLWLALTAAVAAAGALRFDGRPPTAPVLFVLVPGVALLLGLSPLGRRLARGLPLAVLVGFQGFRVVVELLLHRAWVEGLMPVQMSYEGLNFDVVSGLTALPLAAVLATGRRPLGLVRLWNWGALLLLANIVIIAILSTPMPFRVFHAEPANVWITRAPWVWLPTVMVVAAIVGHVLVFRRLRLERAAGSSRGTGPAPAGAPGAAGAA